MRIKTNLVSGIMSATILFSGLAMTGNVVLAADEIAIDKAHFPDANFREYLAKEFDSDKDGKFSQTELDKVDYIFCHGKNIASVEGIKYFQNLTNLSVGMNNITNIDISKNQKLTSLDCNRNQISILDVSNNPNLKNLSCEFNKLTSLDISNNTDIYYLTCGYNQISKLDVSKQPLLETLRCEHNQLTSIDISQNPLIDDLNVSSNKLTSLDISNNPLLEIIDFSNNDISDIDISLNKELMYFLCENNKLTSVDFSNTLRLVSINCSGNKLTAIDVSMLPRLLSLSCSENNISSVNVANNSQLSDLTCGNNPIDSIDISGNQKLYTLICNDANLTNIDVTKNATLGFLVLVGNNITELDVSHNPNLEYLYFSNTRVSSIDLSKNPNLTVLACDNTPLSTLDLSNTPYLTYLQAQKTNIKELDLSNTAFSRPDWGAINMDFLSSPIYFDTIHYYETDTTICLTDDGLKCITILEPYYVEIYGTDALGIELENGQIATPYESCLLLDKSTKYTGIGFKIPAPEPIITPTPTVTPTPTTTVAPSTPSKTPTSAPTTAPGSKPTVAPTTVPAAKPTTAPGTTAAPTTKPGVTTTPGATTAPSTTIAPNKPGTTTTAPAKPTTTTTPKPSKPQTGVSDKAGTVEDFAERLYTTCLGRDSEKAGKDYWVSELKAGKPGSEVAQGFFFSPEFIGFNLDNDEYITRLYRTFMGREPDKDGMNYWLSEMKNGQGRVFVFDGFVNSPEWADICLTYGIRSGGLAEPTFEKQASKEVLAFAERLYTTCLGRDAEPEGLKYWSQELANLRQTGTVAASGFFNSPEFIGLKTDDNEYITRLYRTFMGREPEKAGFDYWMSELKAGKDRQFVFDGFSVAPEFANLCADAGIMR